MKNIALWLLAFALALTTSAKADEFPSKPIKMIVPYAAGGGTDIVARIVAQKLQEKWGQPAVVENRGGVRAHSETSGATITQRWGSSPSL